MDEWSEERELFSGLMELPLELVRVGELDRALAVARAFTFAAVEAFKGDIAIIFAESGKRDEALAQIEANLEAFPESCLTAIKSGEAYESLGDLAEAEASYRRAMVLAKDDEDEQSAFDCLVGLLEDSGRFEEIDALMSPAIEDAPRVEPRLPSVGRNEPCPCGSGKKYKKCHGA